MLLEDIPDNFEFFMYQDVVNNNVIQVPSHIIFIGCDYRFEVDENPIKLLRDRRCDYTCVGRYPMKKCELMLKKNCDC